MSSNDGIAEQVLACEHALNEAMISGDIETIKRLMADDVVYVHSTAVSETRDGYLAAYLKGSYKYGAIDSQILDTRIYGSCVIITGTHRSQVGSVEVALHPIRTLFVQVWMKNPSGWQLVHRQATRVPD
jgi:ketosteroid isomerase-like protein